MMKPSATFQPRSSDQMPATRSSAATTTATTPTVRYWRLRYAEAPSWIAAWISRMRSLPGDCCSTQRVRYAP